MERYSSTMYDGYAIFSGDRKPLGVVSSNYDRKAICNTYLIPETIKKYLIAIEDKRFNEHGAIDYKSILRALVEDLKAFHIVQGGSTITQQLARNMLRDNRKNIQRKVREILLAFKLESTYDKNEIIEMYFSNVFWGKQNYGIRSASLEYFAKEPEYLSLAEQISLLTFLRGPNLYLKNNDNFNRRFNLLTNVLSQQNLISHRKLKKIKNTSIELKNNPLEIFRNGSVPYIANKIIENKHTIISSLNCELQKKVTKFIQNSKYPLSVIALENGKIIGLSSTYGSDYPFVYKSNVGSVLKPFIYCFLRNNGIGQGDRFNSNLVYNTEWNIREVQNNQKELTLKEALFYSNNNTFVNASYKVGIENTLSFLSNLTNKPFSNFVPSSVLGASIEGFTLYELVSLYDNFFLNKKHDIIKDECLAVMSDIASVKFNGELLNTFLKTGTTNNNKERFAFVGYANKLFGFLRQGNEIDDYTKDGNFISSILNFLKNISKKKYKWDN